MKRRNHQLFRGFTLIELLVVIAIIGVLSSIVVVSVNASNSKARDSKRIAEISSIRKALEQYKLDNGAYPVSTGWYLSNNANWNTLQTALSPYLSNLPVDPINNGVPYSGQYGYGYISINNPPGSQGKWYALVFTLENENQTLSATDGTKLCDGTVIDYGAISNNSKIITFGGQC